jgi:stringent starvation protein B
MNALESTSTRPYLIRALYDWCTDNGFTPYVAVQVDESVQVPREYVKNGEIVLNISFDATSSLKLGNDFIEFKARFAGSAREIIVPVNRVIAIYARENGQGMAFPMPAETTSSDPAEGGKADAPGPSSRGPRLAGSAAGASRKGGTALTLSPAPGLPKPAPIEPPAEPPPPSPPPGPKRPSLKRVK